MPNVLEMNRQDQDYPVEAVLRRYERAMSRRRNWEKLWQECYDYVLPQRGDFLMQRSAGVRRTDEIYDATAMDAAEQLAASLFGNLTPPWSQWFGLRPGPELPQETAASLAPVLEKAARTIQDHLDRSNFGLEMHQCFLDLVVGGTATLLIEESEPGAFSAFKFTSMPLAEVALEEGEDGRLDGLFRTMAMTLGQIRRRFPDAELPPRLEQDGLRDPQLRFEMLEALFPQSGRYTYLVMFKDDPAQTQTPLVHHEYPISPVISFRWLKSPGEIYGRSPVMKALPDIKTANKVVELVLKNASIAVTGIWQADDDGILNPANIELVPGTIIPKAVGSDGLKPLEMPGRFDISQLVLDDLRARISHALLADKLGPVGGAKMTATEVLERSAEMALLLGATYGRLQTELLTPLVQRAFEILKRRGEVPDIALDGRYVTLDYRAPLARSQGQRNVQNTLSWLNSVLAMGPEAAASVNLPEAARFLGRALGVPDDLMVLPPSPATTPEKESKHVSV